MAEMFECCVCRKTKPLKGFSYGVCPECQKRATARLAQQQQSIDPDNLNLSGTKRVPLTTDEIVVARAANNQQPQSEQAPEQGQQQAQTTQQVESAEDFFDEQTTTEPTPAQTKQPKKSTTTTTPPKKEKVMPKLDPETTSTRSTKSTTPAKGGKGKGGKGKTTPPAKKTNPKPAAKPAPKKATGNGGHKHQYDAKGNFISVSAEKPKQEVKWNDRRQAVVKAMRKLGAVNESSAQTAEAIAAAAAKLGAPELKDRVDLCKVCLDVYRPTELLHNGYAKSCRVDGERSLRYFLTAAGQKVKMD